MAGTTPIYGFPYETLGDAPNGAQGLQDLATAVEAQLVRKDTGFAIHSRLTSGTASFVKPTGPAAKVHWVRIWAGGGQGGGTLGAGSGLSEGAGGGGGGYVEKWYLDSALSASESYTVGAGGSTGAAGAAGQAGGNTTFKGLTAGGGGGGTPMTSGTTTLRQLRGAGGSAAGGDVNCPGGDGGTAVRIGSDCLFFNFGGASPGGGGITQQSDFVASAGTAGAAPGGGGSGSFSSTTSFAGGAGAAGGIVIISFY